jgi:hypothetical protein
MARRHGPQLSSLIYDKAFEADHVKRPEAADSHQGQGHEQSRNRPDRFVHSTPPALTDRLAREASIDYPAIFLAFGKWVSDNASSVRA